MLGQTVIEIAESDTGIVIRTKESLYNDKRDASGEVIPPPQIKGVLTMNELERMMFNKYNTAINIVERVNVISKDISDIDSAISAIDDNYSKGTTLLKSELSKLNTEYNTLRSARYISIDDMKDILSNFRITPIKVLPLAPDIFGSTEDTILSVTLGIEHVTTNPTAQSTKLNTVTLNSNNGSVISLKNVDGDFNKFAGKRINVIMEIIE